MAGYTRVFNKSTGDVIEASDFNTEYQSLEAAFVLATGHKHDGTAGEGAYIPTLSGVSNNNSIEVDEANNEIDFYIDVSSAKTLQLQLQDGVVIPATDNDIDLGSASKKFKDLYLAGDADIAGNVILGSDASDLITFNGDTSGDITPNADSTDSIGSASLKYLNLYVDNIVGADFTDRVTYNVNATDNTINCGTGNYFTDTVSGATTYSFDSVPSNFYIMVLELTNGGSAAVTWPAAVDWPTGTAPTLTAAGVDVLIFITDDSGTTWRGSHAMVDSK